MPMDSAEIEGRIRAAFPDAQVIMVDLAGDGDHWAARVTSAAFAGKSRIQQHKLVYAAIGADMGGALHALALQTFVPATPSPAGE
ncbi:BolA family protein [Novosphingobium album (ex Liu et al. 2023)]|uniref:BolA family transcriptional regulator n=1 Tax=Novosphingobium album (ex Liu et al. 2023) TaxID=3031130 RepID=A0ABT5WSL4_9SPHN|nr:BolA family transcriptional regulator [Novosphingobium album (ex Liu et al. 2023)]MDE8652227.1 BolA family transcriptional regulator [Novosphingobium album (ex Liu et al. 2023)]